MRDLKACENDSVLVGIPAVNNGEVSRETQEDQVGSVSARWMKVSQDQGVATRVKYERNGRHRSDANCLIVDANVRHTSEHATLLKTWPVRIHGCGQNLSNCRGIGARFVRWAVPQHPGDRLSTYKIVSCDPGTIFITRYTFNRGLKSYRIYAPSDVLIRKQIYKQFQYRHGENCLLFWV